MSQPTIDFNEIADGVTAILDARVHGAQLAQREADRLADEQAQRESEQAKQAQTQREAQRAATISRLEAEQRNCHDRLLVLDDEMRTLPRQMQAERDRLNHLLHELARLRKG